VVPLLLLRSKSKALTVPDACQPPKSASQPAAGRQGIPARHEAPKGLSWSPQEGQQVGDARTYSLLRPQGVNFAKQN
jgi:hypothetical protein